MKTLITLSVLQTIGLAVLIIQSFGNGPQSAPGQQPQNAGVATSPQSTRTAPDGNALSADEKRLRNIVRQELARVQVQPNAPSSASAARPVDARDEPTLHQQQLIAQQIETYRAVGSITDEQMHELQVDIAQLDEASRREMMSRLIRALNSGELKGRL